MRLRFTTDPAFTEIVFADFDSFLLDHAACERKASALALSLIAHYPDRVELVAEMVALAQEELDHFARVVEHIYRRGLILGRDEKDPYVGAMRKLQRNGREGYFLDRLLVAGIIEARGCERFSMVAEAIGEGELGELYRDIARSEARHHGLFVRLARTYFSESEVAPRLEELLQAEGAIVSALPLRAKLH